MVRVSLVSFWFMFSFTSPLFDLTKIGREPKLEEVEYFLCILCCRSRWFLILLVEPILSTTSLWLQMILPQGILLAWKISYVVPSICRVLKYFWTQLLLMRKLVGLDALASTTDSSIEDNLEWVSIREMVVHYATWPNKCSIQFLFLPML